MILHYQVLCRYICISLADLCTVFFFLTEMALRDISHTDGLFSLSGWDNISQTSRNSSQKFSQEEVLWFIFELSVYFQNIKQNLHPFQPKEIKISGLLIFHLTFIDNLLTTVSVCDETHVCCWSLNLTCSSQKTQPLWCIFPILNLKPQLQINRKQVIYQWIHYGDKGIPGAE